jgi:tetratricopeptide (TPR) repeat protein
MSRLDTLRAMLEQDPANTFARYGLATELKNTGDLAGAILEFERLLSANANYSAAFFHGGQTLEKLGRLAEAKVWYTRGLQATVNANDAHAKAEMQAALDLLG